MQGDGTGSGGQLGVASPDEALLGESKAEHGLSPEAEMRSNHEPSPQVLQVALINHRWGNPNLGVRALTECSVRFLREVIGQQGATALFQALDPGGLPDSSDIVPMKATVSLKPWRLASSFVRLLRRLRDVDLVVDIGEGDGFAGIYGPRRFVWQLLPKVAAIAARTPLVLAPQTFGPFTSKVQLALFRWVCRRSALCAARDSVSLSLASQSGPATRAILVADLAFALPFIQPKCEGPNPRTAIGLNVSGLLWTATAKDKFYVPNYKAVIIELTQRLGNDRSHEIHLISHVGGEQGGSETSDFFACTELAERNPDLKLVPLFKDPSSAKDYIAGLDFFVGSRMHACIAAASAGVPFVALSYSRKFDGAFAAVGLESVIDPCANDPARTADSVLQRLNSRTDQTSLLGQAAHNARASHHRYARELAEVIAKVQP